MQMEFRNGVCLSFNFLFLFFFFFFIIPSVLFTSAPSVSVPVRTLSYLGLYATADFADVHSNRQFIFVDGIDELVSAF